MSAEPNPAPAVAPYFPPPTYPPPPAARSLPTDRRAITALVAAIFGLVFAFAGLPGLIFGPVAYFLGKSAVGRINDSRGAVGGRGAANAAWVLGIAATALGALVTLILLVILLVALSTPPA